MHPWTAGILERIDAQTDRIEALVRPLDADVFTRRPSEARWSVGEHLAHVALVSRAYLPRLREAADEVRRLGRRSDGSPFRDRLLASWFVRSLEPPPRLRIRTPSAAEPPEHVDLETALRELGESQEDLRDALHDADGWDLAEALVTSPFLRLLRIPAHQAAEAVVAHTDRHRWLMEETLTRLGPAATR